MALQTLLPVLLAAQQSAVISLQCQLHLAHYLQNVRSQLWAMQMLDASTKVPEGVLFGNLQHLGNYDECIAVTSSEAIDGQKFHGNYCSLGVVFTEPNTNQSLAMRWALCLPSTCSTEDATSIGENNLPALISSALGVEVNATVVPSRTVCKVKKGNEELSAGAIVSITLLALLAAFVVLSTLVNWYFQKKGGKKSVPLTGWWYIFEPFNAYSTSAQLTSTRKQPGSIHCIHGIRVISMLMVLTGHRYNDDFNGPISNGVQRADYFKNPLNMFIANAYLDVETFLFMSGILICYNAFKLLDNKKFNLLRFYANRYLRLTVPFAFVILIAQFLPQLWGDGPLFEEENNFDCSKTWWHALLYIQNYNEFGNYCLTNTWYLCVDMQLAFLSPLVVLPLYFAPNAGLQILILLGVISCFIPFTVTYVNELFWALNLVDWQQNFAYTVLMYFPTHTKATPYICGIFLAYFLHKYKDKKVKLNKWFVAFMWTASIAVMATVVMSLSIAYQDNYSYNKLDAAFYAGFHPLGWSLGAAWIVFACVFGYGGFVNSFFSWKLFLPLSRLCYGAYLLQFFVIRYTVGSLRAPIYASHFTSFHNLLGDLPLTILLSACLFFMVEAPTGKILRKIFK